MKTVMQTPSIPIVPQARRMVHTSLRRSGLLKRFQSLADSDSTYADVAYRVAWYLSLKVKHPHTKKPLLHQCLAEAVGTASDLPKSADARARLAAYVDTLIDHVMLILRYRISHDGLVWDPLYGEPLMEWFRRGECDVDRNTDDVSGMVATTSYRTVMAGRLTGAQATLHVHPEGVHA